MKKIFLLGLIASSVCFGVRLKDLATVRGMKDNQLMGYGVVVGLPGTGDRASEFTETSLDTALRGLGVDPKTQRLGTKNSAAVIVTAILPPFTRAGAKLDVIVSSIGSASSLEGGSLMMTPLKGADGKVYAIAAGRLGVTRRAERSTSAFQSMLSTVIPQAAILERDVSFNFADIKSLKYQLSQPDFTTAARISQKINEELGGKYATATDPGTVDVILPYGLDENPVDVVARIESVDIEPDRRAVVVVNRKSGTVVLGENVHVYPVAIAHNNLRILIKDDARNPSADNPNADPVRAGQGELTPVPTKPTRQVEFATRGTSIADVVTSLNEVGASPDDLVFLIKSLQETGALVAELELK